MKSDPYNFMSIILNKSVYKTLVYAMVLFGLSN